MSVQKIDRYEVQTELGRGGMATVYRAHDPRFKRVVAVKVLPREFLHDPNFRARFEREAETIAKLEHAAIVPVYDYGEEDGQPYLVMRYMGGGSLAERIEEGPLALSDITAILARLAPALDKAHRQGITHRDLKPGNILFDEDGDAYLSDFGIVKIAQSTSAITESGGLVGTPAYMAPEQVHGDVPVDFRADLYALGVIVFEMLAGKKPYHADTPPKLMMKHVMDPIPDITAARPQLAPEWDSLIQRAMAKDPEARYQSARDLAKAAASAAGEPTPAGLETPTPARRRRPAADTRPGGSRRRLALSVGIGVALVAAVLTGVILASQNPATSGLQGTATPTQEPTALPSRFTALRTILSPYDDLERLSISPDQTMLASSGCAPLAETTGCVFLSMLWEVETGRRVRTLEARTRPEIIFYAADGTLLAFRNEGLEETLVNIDSGETLCVFTGLAGSFHVMQMSPDESLVASFVDNPSTQRINVSLWNAGSGQLLFSFDENDLTNGASAFSPDSHTLATDTEETAIVLWDTATGERLSTIRGHTQAVRAIAWSPDGTDIVSAANDGTVVVWDAATGERRLTFEIDAALPRSVAVSPDGSLLVAGVSDGRVLVWDFQTGEQVAILTEHTPGLSIDFVLFSADGTLLITANSLGGEIVIWEDDDG